jgi:hypothetical protein
MAKMNTQSITITVSELVPNGYDAKEILDSETILTLKQALEEMVGAGKLVEVETVK